MAQDKSLAVPANGRILQLSFGKYSDMHVAAASYPSTEICGDLLVLSDGRTISNLLAETLAAYNPQTGPSLNELRDQACLREFGKPLGDLIYERKEALRQRYSAALATRDRAIQVEELRACARQGHVQANMDLGRLFDAEGNLECMDFFGEAHNLGHPSSLLELSKTFLKADDAGQAVRVLLLGSFCGSFICVQALLAIRQHRLHRFEAPACLAALEEWCAYGSIHAKYLLGYVLLHGDSCRDEVRGQALIREAAAVRPFKGGDKGRVPLVPGGKKFHAGTLSHMEQLIDIELSAIRSKELGPKFVVAAAKLPGDSSEASRAAFSALLQEFNPAPERMKRRFDKKVANWLEEGADEPVDEAKLERMKALALPDKDASKEDGNA
ncbi:hypothetical protein WJ96_06845 [Burkholderia ubonensis]|uniref:Uncharacterized protein n=1 Tax=Burkholderia ubonensis TaxID=101571 RepID=A0AAW3MWN5_9BURK|nr:hypothetical protein [Burkholderia ubonensis]KVP75421.1 hypothetical protein WJ93_08640 [Burkholderia ubonensis]KVP98234.1 hypothetical protein WJ96_06845 [Burkholderia ubonensis]KVZ92931.1 hypothetical protein WL25_18505 [Burkholderia ubonensis]